MPSGNATESFIDTPVSPSTQYFYRISVTTGAGTSTPAAVVNTTTPAMPATPSGLAANPTSPTLITVTWNAVAGVTTYLLERSPNGASGWTTLNNVTPSGNATESYLDGSVLASTQYFYRISSTNSAGTGTASASVNATTPAPAFSAPASLTATVNSSTQITLNWSAVTGATNYKIERSPDGQTGWTQVGATTTALTLANTGLTATTRYYYRVKANNGTVDSSPSPTASAITLQPTALSTVRIETGGTTNYVDTHGNTWIADKYFSGGYTGTSTFAVGNTTDPSLYYSRRWTNFTYAIPVTNGTYDLNLYFAETRLTGPNQRVFNVFAEGTKILSNFDIFAQAGFQNALIKSFTIPVTDGTLNLQFQNVTDEAIVSAIEVLPLTPAAPTTLTGTAQSSSQVTLNWADNSNNESNFVVERQGPSDANFVAVATLGFGVNSFVDTTGLTGATQYSYRVKAINAGGSSAYTNILQVSTL